MKKATIFLIMVFIVLTGIVKGQSINKSLVYKGAVSWYPMEGNGADSIGDNLLKPHHITYELDSVRGMVALFDHTDTSYFEFSKAPVSGEQFTIATWFYYGGSYKDYWQTIFEFVNDANLNNFYFSPNFGTIGVVSENKTKGKWESISAATYQTPVNQWIHLAITFDEGNVVIYANGSVVGAGTVTNTMDGLSCNRFFIGADPLRLWKAMDAKFDDFAVYNKVLNQAQVFALTHDTLAGPPTGDPYVFEAEDYLFDNWQQGKDGNTTYCYYSSTPHLPVNAENSLLYGVIKGQEQLYVWARVNSSVKIENPFWIQMDNDAWKLSDSISPASGWQWVLMKSLSPSNGSKHTLRIAPAVSKLKVDKFLVTMNWLYDPNKDYIRKDTIAPGIPKNFSITNLTEYSSLLKWHSSPAKDSTIAYDILEGNKVIATTTDTSLTPSLCASTQYGFSVRAKDKAGNVSDKTSEIVVTTKDLVFTADFNYKNQKIHHFGASDAWSVETIGLWPSIKRDSLAMLLFSKKFDGNGNPEGAGLSNWRFRIGDGSRDQSPLGLSSGNWFKTTHCFLNSKGIYDWNNQAGSQWFLKKAKEYGVQHFTGWTDSPPYFMTKSGYVFRITNVTNGYNLDPGKYNDYALFLANVANHFESEGIHFDVISPVNEPQWSWDYAVGQGGQPGSFCTNSELSNLVKSMDKVFTDKKVKSKILISEAGALDYLYNNNGGNTDNQIYNFWDLSSSLYIGNLESLSNYVSGHGYYTETTVQNTYTSRRSLASKLSLTNSNLEYWQTEYSLLSSGYLEKQNMTPIDYSLFIARTIFYDLTVGNCTGWDWWSTFSRPWGEDHKYRFALINWYPNADDTTCTTGTYEVTKNLWVLGNYSHFVLPGYQRVSILRSDLLTPVQCSDKQLISAFISPGSDTVVYVAINYADLDEPIKLSFKNLPYADSIVNVKTYVTSATENLKAYPEVDMGNDNLVTTLKARSVTTFVGSIKRSATPNTSGAQSLKNAVEINLFPNPAYNMVKVEILNSDAKNVSLTEISGKKIGVYQLIDGKVTIDTQNLRSGFFIVSIQSDNKVFNKKLLVIK
jgi:O-glycosyl hydrolase